MDAKSAEQSSLPPSLSETKPKSSEHGLSEVLIGLNRLLLLLDGLITQNSILIQQNQAMLDLMMQMDPDAEPVTYLDGTRRQ